MGKTETIDMTREEFNALCAQTPDIIFTDVPDVELSDTIDPRDSEMLAAYGNKFWLGSIHEWAVNNIEEQLDRDFAAIKIVDVDHVNIMAQSIAGSKNVTILTMDTLGEITTANLVKAIWAGYMTSLDCTRNNGNNPRAHTGDNPNFFDIVLKLLGQLRAKLKPHSHVYGSAGNYLEALDFSYDAATRTLNVMTEVGS